MKFLTALCLCFILHLGVSQALPGLSGPKTEPVKTESVSWFKPIQTKIFKWNARINREVQKHMKALKDQPSPLAVFTAIFAAFIYGILHTLGPGHGKMVVASYFTTHGAHFWRGLFVGVQVAIAHVSGAVLLVLTTDFAMRQILSNTDQALYLLRTISFSLIFVIGFYMLWQAVQHARGKSGTSCSHCDHDHHHDHKHQSKKEAVMSWIVGAVPCTGSLLILLYSMAHDMLYLGLFMVLFVAIGMALTVTSIGWLCILGKQQVLDRFIGTGKSGHRLQISLEFIGAVLIMFIGAALLLAIHL